VLTTSFWADYVMYDRSSGILNKLCKLSMSTSPWQNIRWAANLGRHCYLRRRDEKQNNTQYVGTVACHCDHIQARPGQSMDQTSFMM